MNNIQLTDDEISLMETSLMLTLASYSKYKKMYGENSLDLETENAIKGMKELKNKLNNI
ncbi:hypothetical protein [Virgibacillus sp. Bac332]|uniref:hypothetical protein n=1 Tax=Virgibacillus sp. Bac332 TaxID=2419842 RepID=UPI0013CEDF10|nr:hypothetical protein [Virgibacillus sp. Bac332]